MIFIHVKPSFRMLELEGKHEQDVKAVTQQGEKLGFLEQQVNAQCNNGGTEN